MSFEELKSAVAEHDYTLEHGPENIAHPERSVWIARRGEQNIYGDAETIRRRILGNQSSEGEEHG